MVLLWVFNRSGALPEVGSAPPVMRAAMRLSLKMVD